MENIKISTNNVFDERFEKFSQSRRAAKLQQKFKDLTFDERTKKFAVVAFVLTIGCTLFSAFSAHFYLLNIFNSLGSGFVAIALTVIILGCIEYGKRDVIPQFFKNWFQYKSFDGTNLTVGLGLIGLSVVFSFLGSHLIPGKLSPPPTMISVDSVSTHYDNLIEAKANAATTYFNQNNWKGKLDNTSRPTYNKLLDEKLQLESDKTTEINKANTANEETLRQHELKLKSNGIQLGYITLGSEFLLVLLIGFLEYRDFRAISQFANIENHESNEVDVNTIESQENKEQNSNGNHQQSNSTNTASNGSNSSSTPTNAPSNTNNNDDDEPRNKRTIVQGFVNRPNGQRSNDERQTKEDKNNSIQAKEKPSNGQNQTNNAKTKDCKNCGTAFTYKHWNKQYCSDKCRIEAWENRTGKKLQKKRNFDNN